MAKKLRSVLILAVGLGLVYWFVQGLNWQEMKTHLREAQIWPLLVAALLINLTLLFRALRWQAFLAPIAPVSLHHVFAATAVGFGSVFVIGRAGEVVRPMVLSLRERLRPSATFATIMIERLFDMTAVISLFAANLVFFRLPAGKADDLKTLSSIRSLGLALLLGLVVGITILVLLRLKAKALLGFLERKTQRLPGKLVNPFLNLFRHLAEGLSVLLNLRELALTGFYTLVVWSLVSTATWLVTLAFGLALPASYVIFILGFGLVGSVVPTPGGSAGAFHAAIAAGLIFLGIERNLAAGVAILLHLVAFGPPFLIGLFYLIRDGIGVSQLRKMISPEERAKSAS